MSEFTFQKQNVDHRQKPLEHSLGKKMWEFEVKLVKIYQENIIDTGKISVHFLSNVSATC